MAVVEVADLLLNLCFWGIITCLPVFPVVIVSVRADRQPPQQPAYPEFFMVLFDKSISLSSISFAKNAAAFFRKSISFSFSASSFRRRRFSFIISASLAEPGDWKALGLAFFLEFAAPAAECLFGDVILRGDAVDRSSFFQTETDQFLFKFG